MSNLSLDSDCKSGQMGYNLISGVRFWSDWQTIGSGEKAQIEIALFGFGRASVAIILLPFELLDIQDMNNRRLYRNQIGKLVTTMQFKSIYY